MITGCHQKGTLIYVYTSDRGNVPRTYNGWLVGWNGNTFSYITQKGSRLVNVRDENMKDVSHYNAPDRITKGDGWSM